jgi:hypothetical protein
MEYTTKKLVREFRQYALGNNGVLKLKSLVQPNLLAREL